MTYDAEQFHKDAEGRLNSLAFFSDITIIRDTPGVIDADVEQALSTLNKKTGKAGACIVLMAPQETVPDPDMVGPEILIRMAGRIYTDALVNLGANGTGKSNARIRREYRKAFHHWTPNGANAVYCDKKGGDPLDLIDGVESYEIDVLLPLPEEFETAFLPEPVISGTAAAVSITSMTNGAVNNARIWYSLDGSFPSPESATSFPFGYVLLTESGIAILSEPGNELMAADPISVPPGTTIRAAAYLDGYPGSSVAVKTINS